MTKFRIHVYTRKFGNQICDIESTNPKQAAADFHYLFKKEEPEAYSTLIVKKIKKVKETT